MLKVIRIYDTTVSDDLIFVTNRLIALTTLRAEMLKILYEPHLGIEKTKRNARSMLYWLKMAIDTEDLG